MISPGHEVSGLGTMYDFATGYSTSGTSSSVNSDLYIGSSAERLQQENRMLIDIMEQDIELC